MRGLILFVALLFLNLTLSAQEKEVAFAPVETFRLAAPQWAVDSVLFYESTTFQLALNHPDVNIYYTDDGTKVNEASKRYTVPIQLKHCAKIRAKAYHPDFLESEETVFQFAKIGQLIKEAKVQFHSAPVAPFLGNGPQSMADLEKGRLSFRKDPAWSGFRSDTVSMTIQFSKAKTLSALRLSLLEDHNAWIFLPLRIEVWAGEELVGVTLLGRARENHPAAFHFVRVELYKKELEQLQIRIINDVHIPEWHKAAGKLPWLFIDEILVY